MDHRLNNRAEWRSTPLPRTAVTQGRDAQLIGRPQRTQGLRRDQQRPGPGTGAQDQDQVQPPGPNCGLQWTTST